MPEPIYPTIDLHCHLRGTMLPELALALSEKNGVALSIDTKTNCYSYKGFEDFLSVYNKVGRVVATANDLREIAFQYMKTVSLEGTLYVEFMLSPMHSIENGISFESQMSAISDAIEQAHSEFDINGSILITCVRHRGPDEANLVANLVAKYNCKYICGFGLTGNEQSFSIDKFQNAFLLAEDCGLGLTAHTGEWLPAQTILDAVNLLKLSRVGHGVSVVDNPEIMAELSERKIGFEVCLSSNVYLGASESFEMHPAREMLNAGCVMTFSTDDPAYFDTTPKKEMQLATKHLGLDECEQYKCLTNGIGMAFCDDATKKKMLAHISGSQKR